jgi:poly(3-hydroxyalkanoate) depolymerase
MTVRQLEVHGLRLRVQEVGSGEPLLLINGLGGCLETWRTLTERLPGRRCIAIDHPGTGLSAVPPGMLSMADIAHMYAAALDELGYTEVDVMGFSFGGAVAQEFAHRHPQRVRRLILAATAYGVGSTPADPMTLMAASSPIRYISRTARRVIAPMIYRGRVGRNPELLQTELRGVNAHPASMVGVYYQVSAYSRWSSAGWLHTLTMPTLVLGGSEDPMAPAVNSVVLARRIPSAKLVIISGGGHLFPFDSAEQVAPLLLDFLASERRAA